MFSQKDTNCHDSVNPKVINHVLLTCGPQKFMQPWFSAHIHDVIQPGQGDSQPEGGLECGADVLVVRQGDRLADPGFLAQCWSVVDRDCNALASSSKAYTSGVPSVG